MTPADLKALVQNTPTALAAYENGSPYECAQIINTVVPSEFYEGRVFNDGIIATLQLYSSVIFSKFRAFANYTGNEYDATIEALKTAEVLPSYMDLPGLQILVSNTLDLLSQGGRGIDMSKEGTQQMIGLFVAIGVINVDERDMLFSCQMAKPTITHEQITSAMAIEDS